MTVNIEFFIAGEEDRGPIDLEASLAKLRAMLEDADDLQDTTVSLRVSPVFIARPVNAGQGQPPPDVFTPVWQSRSWIVPAATAEHLHGQMPTEVPNAPDDGAPQGVFAVPPRD
jgi:hypothetical protein